MQISIADKAFTSLEAQAEEAVRLLSALANPRRLMALCHMLEGEKSVNQLADLVGLAPAALSQHLARMRDLRLVETRRDGQTIYYRLASAEVEAVLETLYRLYCAPPASGTSAAPTSGTSAAPASGTSAAPASGTSAAPASGTSAD